MKATTTHRRLDQDVIEQCRLKLLALKQDVLNRVMTAQFEFSQHEKGIGDEGDQTMAQIAEDQFLVSQERARRQLFEIESALARIQLGQFGICEETQEPIERERILAIPYTRLSIEGAEIRETSDRKFAR